MNTIITKEKVKEKLKKYLNREPKEGEIINAKQDTNILIKILIDEVENLKIKIKKPK